MTLYDALGREVPDRLVGVFSGRKEIERWCEDINLLIRSLLVIQHAPFARDINVEATHRALELIKTRVMEAAPYSPCRCSPKEHHCPICGGTRWASLREWKEKTGRLPGLQETSANGHGLNLTRLEDAISHAQKWTSTTK